MDLTIESKRLSYYASQGTDLNDVVSLYELEKLHRTKKSSSFCNPYTSKLTRGQMKELLDYANKYANYRNASSKDDTICKLVTLYEQLESKGTIKLNYY